MADLDYPYRQWFTVHLDSWGMTQVDVRCELSKLERRIKRAESIRGLVRQRKAAEELRLYCRSERLSIEIENEAVKLRIQADVFIGEMLIEWGTDTDKSWPYAALTNSQIGLSYNQVCMCRKLAKIPSDVVREYFAIANCLGHRLGSKGLLQYANSDGQIWLA